MTPKKVTIYQVRNKETGIVHTVVAGHYALSDERFEKIDPPKQRAKRGTKHGT